MQTYLKIPENLVFLILLGGFWIVLIPFLCKIKSILLARFPVDLHPYSVMSALIFFLFYCIRLLWDWSFRLYHHIIYIRYFAASYLFMNWSNWSLWWCFVLQFKEFQFLSWSSPILVMLYFSRVTVRLFVHTVVFLPIFIVIFVPLILVLSVYIWSL